MRGYSSKKTRHLRPGMTLLFLLPLLISCGATCPTLAPVNPTLVRPLEFPERPANAVNADLRRYLLELRLEIEADNVRKAELLKQLEKAAQ